MANSNQFLWHSGYNPATCPIHVRNELAIAFPPETVWAWLIRAQLWPTWYPNSANIQFLSGQTPDLALGTKFRWKTFGVTIESTRCLSLCPLNGSLGTPTAPALKLTTHG